VTSWDKNIFHQLRDFFYYLVDLNCAFLLPVETSDTDRYMMSYAAGSIFLLLYYLPVYNVHWSNDCPLTVICDMTIGNFKCNDRPHVMMLFAQTEVVQVVAVQALQAGAQTFADNGPSASAGWYRPPRCGILRCRTVGSTWPDAGGQSDHGVGKRGVSYLSCTTNMLVSRTVVVITSLTHSCALANSCPRSILHNPTCPTTVKFVSTFTKIL